MTQIEIVPLAFLALSVLLILSFVYAGRTLGASQAL